eukprot:gene12030-5429_t
MVYNLPLDKKINCQNHFKFINVEKVFCIKNPGVKHNPLELIKNYLLSFFMNESIQIQNEIYEQLWLPFEKRFKSNKESNDFIKMLCKSENEEPYDVYRDFTEMIEGSLEHEANPIEFIKSFLKNLGN